MDPQSFGLGVPQFKTYLLHRVEREESETKCILAEKDPREIQKYYRLFYEKNIKEGQYTKKPEEMAKKFQTAKVLYDVIVRMMMPPQKIENEIQRYAKDVEEKMEQYNHYNIPESNSAEEGKEKSNRIMATSRALDDSELVPSSPEGIALILRVADEVDHENPRVAYLCRLHAFEEAHRMNPISSGRDDPEFMTYLIHRLEKDKLETRVILAVSDPGEIQKYYQLFYEKNIKEGQYKKKLEEMAKIYQSAKVLYDVVRKMVPSIQIDHETRRYAKDVEEKIEQYKHYNIPPLNADRVKPTIVEQPEVISGTSGASEHLCLCGKPATIWTSLTDANPGRRYYGCQKERVDDGCSYFHWEDNQPLCHRARQVIPSSCTRTTETSEEATHKSTLEQQNHVENIKLNELQLKNTNLEIVNKELKTKNKRLSLWVAIAWTIIVAHCVLRLNEYIDYC